MKSVGNNAENDSSARAALKIMRDWEWGIIDYDGQRVAYSKALSLVISKLGMTGLARSQDAVLSLLCRGELIARGDFFWQKYENGSAQRLNGNVSVIVPQRWIVLSSIMEKERQHLADGLWSLSPVSLPQLGLSGCPAFEWNFLENQIGTATRSAGGRADDPGAIEELFWAWDIEVWPKFIFETQEGVASISHSIAGNVGGRPPVADWIGAALELAGQYYRGDFKPKTVADVTRQLRSLLDAKDIHLHDSTIRPYASQIFAALRTWDD